MSKDMGSASWRKWCLTPMRDLLRGRVTGRLDWQGRIDEAELDEDAKAMIRRVVKKTRLWRLEQAGLAEELIAHFASARDVGATTQQQIAEFGDEKNAAKRLRREKKRRRPLAWRSTARSMQIITAVIAVLIVLYGLAIGWYAMGSPDMSVNYLAKFNARAKAVPKDERAWPIYRDALLHHGLLQIIDGNKPPLWRITLPDGSSRLVNPDDKQWPEVVKFLRGHQKLIEMIRKAASKPGLGLQRHLSQRGYSKQDRLAIFGPCGCPGQNPTKHHADPVPTWKSTPLMGIVLPLLDTFQTITSGLFAEDVRWAARRGDGGQVVADVEAVFGMANQTREAPTLIADLKAHGILSNGFRFLAESLYQHPRIFSDAQLVTLTHRLGTLNSYATIHFAGNKMAVYDFLQRIYGKDGNVTLGGLLFLNRWRSEQGLQKEEPYSSVLAVLKLPLENFRRPDRAQVLHHYKQLMVMEKKYARQPLWILLPHAEPPPNIDTATQWFQAHKLWVLGAEFPSFSVLGRIAGETIAVRDALQVAIALELYRRQHHNHYPETLTTLVPRYLPKLPIDYSTGKPLLYKIVKGRPLLYGRGQDGTDNGGKMGEDQKEAMDGWTIPEQGDWVLYPYRKTQVPSPHLASLDE